MPLFSSSQEYREPGLRRGDQTHAERFRQAVHSTFSLASGYLVSANNLNSLRVYRRSSKALAEQERHLEFAKSTNFRDPSPRGGRLAHYPLWGKYAVHLDEGSSRRAGRPFSHQQEAAMAGEGERYGMAASLTAPAT